MRETQLGRTNLKNREKNHETKIDIIETEGRGDRRKSTATRRSGAMKSSKPDVKSRREIERKKRRRKRRIKARLLRTLVFCIAVLIVYFGGSFLVRKFVIDKKYANILENPPMITEDLLTNNEYSRPGTTLKKVKGIVVHYTANPKTSAKQNRDYFESLKETHETKVSSHLIVGIDGEIIRCIPDNEISYASNDRNSDTISIECCHPDATGKFTDATYNSLIKLTAYYCCKYNLDVSDVIRHYDVTGKSCPKYFVDNEDEWNTFKKDIKDYIELSQKIKS